MNTLKNNTRIRRASQFVELAIIVAIIVALAGIVFLALTGYVGDIFDNLGGWIPGVG